MILFIRDIGFDGCGKVPFDAINARKGIEEGRLPLSSITFFGGIVWDQTLRGYSLV